MDFALTAEQEALRAQIVRFAREQLNAGARERDREQEFPRALWRACGALGLPGLPVPPELGGSGLDSLSTVVALEALGYGCHDGGLVFSLVAHLVSCVVPFWRYGNDEQKGRYLRGLCTGELIGNHAVTEPDSGSDAFAMRTRAERDGSGFRITGRKAFVTNAPVADVLIVYAITDAAKRYHGGVTAFVVDRGTSGLHVGPSLEKMGLRSAPLGELVLDDVRVAPEAVLGGIGGGSRLFTHSMNWERACVFAAHVGTMQRLLETAVAYARTRSQFGQRIGKFQAVSHRIADMKVALEAARLLVYKAAWSLEHSKAAAADAAIAKLFVSESLVASAFDALRIHGGYGYMTEYEVERALRDAVASTIYSGTSEVQRNIIARWLGL